MELFHVQWSFFRRKGVETREGDREERVWSERRCHSQLRIFLGLQPTPSQLGYSSLHCLKCSPLLQMPTNLSTLFFYILFLTFQIQHIPYLAMLANYLIWATFGFPRFYLTECYLDEADTSLETYLWCFQTFLDPFYRFFTFIAFIPTAFSLPLRCNFVWMKHSSDGRNPKLCILSVVSLSFTSSCSFPKVLVSLRFNYLILFSIHSQAQFFGSVGVFLSICLYASPLSTLREVVKTGFSISLFDRLFSW